MDTEPMVRDETVTLDGLRFHYRDWGDPSRATRGAAARLSPTCPHLGHRRRGFGRPLPGAGAGPARLRRERMGRGLPRAAVGGRSGGVRRRPRAGDLLRGRLLHRRLGGHQLCRSSTRTAWSGWWRFECFTDPDVAEEAPYRHAMLDPSGHLLRSLPETFASLEEAVAAFRPLAPYAAEDELRHWMRGGLKQGADGRWTWRYDPIFRTPGQPAGAPERGPGCPGRCAIGRGGVPDAAAGRGGVVDGGADAADGDGAIPRRAWSPFPRRGTGCRWTTPTAFSRRCAGSSTETSDRSPETWPRGTAAAAWKGARIMDVRELLPRPPRATHFTGKAEWTLDAAMVPHYRTVLPGHNSVAWLLWHIARGEDWAIQTILQGREQLLTREGWGERMGVTYPGFGGGMSREEMIALSEQIDLEALRGYYTAVAAATQAFMRTFDFAPRCAVRCPQPAGARPGSGGSEPVLPPDVPALDDAAGLAGGLRPRRRRLPHRGRRPCPQPAGARSGGRLDRASTRADLERSRSSKASASPPSRSSTSARRTRSPATRTPGSRPSATRPAVTRPSPGRSGRPCSPTPALISGCPRKSPPAGSPPALNRRTSSPRRPHPRPALHSCSPPLASRGLHDPS